MADGKNIDNLNIKINVDKSDAERNINNLNSDLKNIGKQIPSNAFDGLSKSMNNAVGNVNQSLSKMTSSSKTLKDSYNQAVSQVTTPDINETFKNLSNSIGLATANLSKLGQASDGNTSKFATLSNQVKQTFLDKGILTYKGEVQSLETDISKVAEQYNLLYQKALKYQMTNIPQNGDRKFTAMTNELQNLKLQYDDLIGLRNSYVNSGDVELRLNTANFSQKMDEVTAKTSGFREAMSKAGTKVKELGKRLLSTINPFKKHTEESKKATGSSNLLARALGKTWMMLKRLVTRMILKGMISSVREGFKNLAIYSEDVNDKISRIGASLIQLKNAFAVAFMPLISFITPVLEKVIDAISFVFNKLGEFFSAITGKSSFVKTLKPAYDYAKSVSDSTEDGAKNTDKIKKNAKEIKNATIGIDRLNVISPDKDNTTPSTGSSGNKANKNNVADMFETKSVSKGMKNLANQVKKIAKNLWQPIENAWNKTKDNIFGSWHSALYNVWQLLKDIATDFYEVWQENATQKIFEDIFNILAGIGQIISNFAKSLRKAWNENNTGKKILQVVRDIIGVIVGFIYEIVDATADFTANLNLAPLLQSILNLLKPIKTILKAIGDLFSNIYENLILPIFKHLIENTIPDLVNAVAGLLKMIPWEDISKKIGDTVVALEPLWKTIADVGARAFSILAKVLGKVIKLLWDSGIIQGILNISKEVTKFSTAVGKGLVKLLELTEAIIDTKITFGDALTEMGEFIKSSKMFANLNDFLSRLGATIIQFVKAVVSGVVTTVNTLLEVVFRMVIPWLLNKIFKPLNDLVSLIENLFGIDIPKLEFSVDGEQLSKDIEKTFKTTMDNLGSIGSTEDAFFDFGATADKNEKKYRKKFKEIVNSNAEIIKKATNGVYKTGQEVQLKEGAKYKTQKKFVDDYYKSIKQATSENNKFVGNFKNAVDKLPKYAKNSIGLTKEEFNKIETIEDVQKFITKAKGNLDELPPKAKTSVQNIIKEFGNIPQSKTTTVKTEVAKGSIENVNNKIDGLTKKDRAIVLKAKLQQDSLKIPSISIKGKITSMEVPKITLDVKQSLKNVLKSKKGTAVELTENYKWGKLTVHGTEKISSFANGGFPELGSLFIAGEKGSELVGQVNGKTGVASNQEITGIKGAIETQGNDEVILLSEQNKLLRKILEKNTDVVLDGKSITKTVNKNNRIMGKQLVYT